MSRWLVTGGAGFIGSCFVRHAVAAGHDVLVVDALTYAGNLASLESLFASSRFRFVHADICDGRGMENLLRDFRPAALIHCAAESHVDRSIQDASPFIRTNIGGTQVLLDALRHSGIEARFLHVSTDEVYGSADDGKPFTENSPLKPSSPYAASKTAADLLALCYAHTFGMDVLVTRSSNNYGPYQFPEKVIPLFITNLLEGRKVPLYGNGQHVRDWIHVEDHSRGICAALEMGRTGEVYNFGGGQPLTNLQLTRALLRATGQGEEFIEYVKDRPGHDRAYLMNSLKAQRELGWRPQISFESGLAQTVEWYREQRAWWEAVKSGAYREYYAAQYGAGV